MILDSFKMKNYLLHMKIIMMTVGNPEYFYTLMNSLNILIMMICTSTVYLMDTSEMILYYWINKQIRKLTKSLK